MRPQAMWARASRSCFDCANRKTLRGQDAPATAGGKRRYLELRGANLTYDE